MDAMEAVRTLVRVELLERRVAELEATEKRRKKKKEESKAKKEAEKAKKAMKAMKTMKKPAAAMKFTKAKK